MAKRHTARPDLVLPSAADEDDKIRVSLREPLAQLARRCDIGRARNCENDCVGASGAHRDLPVIVREVGTDVGGREPGAPGRHGEGEDAELGAGHP